MIRAVLRKRLSNLRIIPIILFILHSTVSRCFSKDSLVSTMIPRCFWDVVCTTLLSAIKCYLVLLLLSASGGCDIALDFKLKMASSACFFGSGLKIIFHWNTYLFIFSKSLFSSKAEVLLSWITENKDVSSTNSLAFEDNPSDKSLIYIKNNNGPSMEPCGTPALTSYQSETFPFNKTPFFSISQKVT